MCNVSMTTPYTTDIVPVQYLPQYFNQSFALDRGYQILNTLGTSFVGYGMAGTSLCLSRGLIHVLIIRPHTSFPRLAIVRHLARYTQQLGSDQSLPHQHQRARPRSIRSNIHCFKREILLGRIHRYADLLLLPWLHLAIPLDFQLDYLDSA